MKAKMKTRKLKMVKEFQCPGCTLGFNTDCGLYKEDNAYGDGAFRCGSHVAGTFMPGVGRVFLGLPIGFNKCRGSNNKMDVWFHLESMSFDKFNIPVWAMVENGYTFVRVYSPRINYGRVHVFEGECFPEGAVDVSKIVNEMD